MDSVSLLVAKFTRMDTKHALLLIVAAGLVARLVMLAVLAPLHDIRGGDGAFYLDAAASLLRDAAYSYSGSATAFRPPGYSAFIALFGGSPPLVAGAQSVLTIGTAAVTFLTLRRDHPFIAILAALLIATSPFLVVYEFGIYSEILYVHLTWLSWLLLYAGRKLAAAVGAGILLGAAILTRDTLLFLPPFALFFAALDRRLWPKLLVALLLSYAVVAPWALRNASVPGAGFEISAGRFGYNLWIGTWERNGQWMLAGLDNAQYPPAAFRSDSEKHALDSAWKKQDDAAYRKVAIDRIAEDPIGTLVTWTVRYPRLWIGTRTDQGFLRTERGSLAWKVVKSGFFGLNALTLLLGFAGLILSLRSRLSFFAIPVLYTALVYAPFHNVETRYSLVAFPFLYLFASIAIGRAALGKAAWRQEVPASSTRRSSLAGLPPTTE